MNIEAMKIVRDNLKMGHVLSFAEMMIIQQAIDAAMLQGKAEPERRSHALPDGWVALPVEPTVEMVKKMRYHCGSYDKNIKDGYKAMLAAAPQQEV